MAQVSKTSNWQTLVSSAYDRWMIEENQNWSFAEMLEACNTKERNAVVLGKLNQQVDNGGFSQWVFNGYAKDTFEILSEILEDMGEVSKQVLVLCEGIMVFVSEDGEWMDSNDDGDFCEAADAADDKASSAFYKISDKWVSEVETLLA